MPRHGMGAYESMKAPYSSGGHRPGDIDEAVMAYVNGRLLIMLNSCTEPVDGSKDPIVNVCVCE